jgi:hypothetical protein
VNTGQKIITGTTMLALLCTAYYAPWEATMYSENGARSISQNHYSPVWQPPSVNPLLTTRIRLDSLGVEWAVILLFWGGLMAIFKDSPEEVKSEKVRKTDQPLSN